MNPFRRSWLRTSQYLTGKRLSDSVDDELRVASDSIGGPQPEGEMRGAKRKKKEALRDQVGKDGREHGASGMYDEWNFTTGTTPPYVTELLRLRDEELAENGIRESRDAQRVEKRIGQARQAVAQAKLNVRQGKSELAEARAAQQELEKIFNGEAEEDHPGYRWAGPAPGLHRRWAAQAGRSLVLLLFMGVELPIQYSTFIYFGESVPMTWAFVLGSATALLVAPHRAGGWAKHARVDGRKELLLGAAAAITMVAWAAAVVILADLRRRTLLAPKTDLVTGVPLPSAADALAVPPLLITALFLVLLVMTGLVAFAFGYTGENPYAAELAAARAATARRARRVAKAKGRLAAYRLLADKAGGREEQLTMRWRHRNDAVRNFFGSCVARYHGAVARAMRNPAATEAVGKPRKQRAEVS